MFFRCRLVSYYLTLTGILLLSSSLHPAAAQSLRGHINDGNKLYKKQQYADAEAEYKKMLNKDNQLLQGYFNLGDAQYKQQRYDEALQNYETALSRTKDQKIQAQLYHNIGNVHFDGKQYQESINAYKHALRLNPNDEETKYNLAYAERMLKQQPPNQQNKQNKNDKNNQDRNNKKNQQHQQQNQQQDQKKNQAQPQGQQQKQMSKAEAQRILEALRNDEKEVQKKLRRHAAVKTNVEKDW
ncbi:MAG: tetratricopeptide repeat protein [Bacteroidota bacterium]|nr:tetratricopeptide repeat protein [Bacteroidota bacterium]